MLPTAATNKTVAAIPSSRLVDLYRQWQALANDFPGIAIEHRRWNVHGGQTLPHKITIADIDTAAAIAGDRQCPSANWTGLLDTARSRRSRLQQVNPALADGQAAFLLRATINYGEADFTLLCRAAQWFMSNHSAAHGLTPRQVPLPGIHAKWLNTHQSHVAALADCDAGGLRLLPNHAPRIHLTYLDPDYRRSGQRVHDSHTLGDALPLPYTPSLVIISENKDTAILFPPTPGAIAVEGAGNEGPYRMSHYAWIADCPDIVYWGDIDAAGFTIVNAYRAELPIRTILMDYPTYLSYAQYGTNHHPDGRLIDAAGPPLPELTASEAAAYAAVTAPAANPRRIEQERIPLHVAVGALLPRRPGSLHIGSDTREQIGEA